jgi:hypothetical protein
MLKTIAEVSPQLVTFILALRLSLSRPQLQHVVRVADALIATEGGKTLSALYRHIVGDPCPKAAADTFREAPWEADDIRITLRCFLVRSAFQEFLIEQHGQGKTVVLVVDKAHRLRPPLFELLRQFLIGIWVLACQGKRQFNRAVAIRQAALVLFLYKSSLGFQRFHQAGGQHGQAVFLAFALAHHNLGLFKVNILDAQAQVLHQAQAAAIE